MFLPLLSHLQLCCLQDEGRSLLTNMQNVGDTLLASTPASKELHSTITMLAILLLVSVQSAFLDF